MIIEGARRIQEVNEYYFSRKLEEIALMNRQGRNVINLGIGSPDLPPSAQTIQAAIESIQQPSVHGYASYRGSLELREAIANWYLNTYRVQLNPQNQVLPLLGSKEGIFYISMAFLNPGDKVLVPNPGYPAYSSVAKLVGAVEIPYDLSEKTDWLPDFTQLSKVDLRGVKLMWVNYPHMPTGRAADRKTFEQLIQFAKKNEILICHDNPYSQVLNPEKPMSLLEFDPLFECSLELNSLSKSFNMAGWRIGMVSSSQEIIDAIIRVKSNADSGMFYPLQAAAVQAFKNTDEWHRQRNEVYKRRRDWAFKIFDQLGYHSSTDQVGLFVWAKAPDRISKVEEHIDEVLKGAAIFLTPGFIFGTNGERYARCSLCASEDKMKMAFERIGGIP